MRTFVSRVVLGVAGLALWPMVASAQTSSVAGVVKDASGGVLPGVTVEAASPALIEKVRSVVADGSGQYKIINLRPGVYTVTFTLTGFTAVRREGIELTSDFTANVNADMKVGAGHKADLLETLVVPVDAAEVAGGFEVVQPQTVDRLHGVARPAVLQR